MQFGFRIICLFLLFLPLVDNVYAQDFPSGEFGVQAGGMFYLGDINKVPFKGTRPAVGVFYRHDFNVRYSAKALATYGNLTASDSKYKSEYQKFRDYSFNRQLVHIGVLGEFNFLPFAFGRKDTPYSTYLQGGIGVGIFPDDSKMDKLIVDIPFGFGVKINSYRRFVYGVDFLMVKTVTDNIDFMSPRPSEINNMKQKYISSNNDWFSYFAIYLAYKIDYPQKCPSFD